ncbi:glycosyltransferase family 39 protein [Oligoflexia bacterium]|nr:glycosyltransferase family 39 protein [Oligoflexia bacterium]
MMNPKGLKISGIDYWPILIFLLSLAILTPLSWQRFVVVDEGFYSIAAKLITEGKTPYHDFFYPQMPLLPYLYAAIYSIFGSDWLVTRIFTALLSALAVTLLFLCVRRELQLRSALIASTLFLSSNMFLAWGTVLKTYSLSILLLLSAYYFLQRGSAERKMLFLFLAGLFLGLSVNTRMFFAVCGLPFLLRILMSDGNKGIMLKYFFFGGILSLLPLLYFLCTCPESFWFGNYGYHSMRSSYSSTQAVNQKLRTLKILFNLYPTPRKPGFQELILIAANLVYFAYALIRGRKLLALSIAFILFFVNFLPTPAHPQYFTAVIPFFIMGFLSLTDQFFLKSRKLYITFMGIIGAAWLFHTPQAVRSVTVAGTDVVGIGGGRPEFSHIWNIQKLENKLAELTEKGEPVLSYWPGYLLGTDNAIVPGMENNFIWLVEDEITDSEKHEYQIRSLQEIKGLLTDNKIRVIVRGRENPVFRTWGATKYGYNKAAVIDGVRIYTRRNLK